MEEKVFFEYEGVRVTNTRFVVDGQTFAMNNVTSVKPFEKRPSRVGPVILIVLGVLSALGGGYLGLIVSFLGATWWYMQKSTYHIMLHTSGGETSALKTISATISTKLSVR